MRKVNVRNRYEVGDTMIRKIRGVEYLCEVQPPGSKQRYKPIKRLTPYANGTETRALRPKRVKGVKKVKVEKSTPKLPLPSEGKKGTPHMVRVDSKTVKLIYK